MGSACATQREKLAQTESMVNAKVKWDAFSEKCGEHASSVRNATHKFTEASKLNYYKARMKALGYTVHMPEDEFVTGVVTQMENELPLCRTSIDEFERRIKKLIGSSDKKAQINVKQMIEVFKDHPQLYVFEDEESLLRRVLTDKRLSKEEGTFHIPYLMLVGILFCASNE